MQAIFEVVGSFGLAKLPGTMRRLHGPTKATTLGIGSLLMASMLYFAGIKGQVSLHELLVTLFLFLTAPITAHIIAKAHILRAKDKTADLADTGSAAGWATTSALVRSEKEARPPV